MFVFVCFSLCVCLFVCLLFVCLLACLFVYEMSEQQPELSDVDKVRFVLTDLRITTNESVSINNSICCCCCCCCCLFG